MSKRKFLKLLEAAQADNDEEAVKKAEGARFKVFTIEYVIKKLIDYGEEQARKIVVEVASWKLQTTENVIKALLINNMDDVAM